MHWMSQSSFFASPEWLSFGLWPALTILPLIIWGLVWKGWALWLAARRGETPWFIILLVINTVGFLEIFYIFVVARRKDTKEEALKVVPENQSESK